MMGCATSPSEQQQTPSNRPPPTQRAGRGHGYRFLVSVRRAPWLTGNNGPGERNEDQRVSREGFRPGKLLPKSLRRVNISRVHQTCEIFRLIAEFFLRTYVLVF